MNSVSGAGLVDIDDVNGPAGRRDLSKELIER